MKRGNPTWASRLHDESGATAVFVAIMLPILFSMVVITVDAGNLWQTRRDVVTATDSTALSEARSAFLGESTGANCTTDWNDGSSLLDINADSALSDTSCEVTRLPNDIGYATVRAKEHADLFFAPAIGLGDSSQVYSLSAAMFAYPLNFTGAAPITFCDQNGHLQDPENPAYHLANGYWKGTAGNVSLTPIGGTAIHRFYFGKDDSADCGESEGNWGWLDFNGGGGGTAEIVDWLINGYTGSQIHYGDHIGGQPGNPSGSAGTNCPGIVKNVSGALDCLIDTGQEIAIIVHDDTRSKNPSKDCNGANCEYQVSSVMGMVLHCYSLTGNNTTCPEVAGDIGRTGQDAQFFDLELVDIILSGDCCSKAPPDGIDRGARSIRLCGIDHDRDSSGTTNEDQLVRSRCEPN